MTLRFMQGGGDMGAMLRAHPWAESPMGLPAHWPSQLKTLVGLMLNAPQPMFAVWGPEQRMFYNDGYAEILGGHHPALDQTFLDVWSEIRSDLEPIMARAYAGEPIYMDDIELTMRRHGHDEETHFSFFYAPVRGDQGEVLGVFCACTEITQEVKARRERTAELDRLREMFTSSPSFVAVLRGPDHRFELTNPAYLRLIAQRDVIGMPVRAALPELEGQGFFELLDTVYRTGETHSGRAARVSLVAEPGTELEERVVDFIYQPMRGADGKVNGIFVEGVDVTEVVTQAQVLRESEEKFRSFAQLAPNHMWTSPADGQLDWFNEQTLRYSGMDMAALCGTGWATLVHPDDLAREVDMGRGAAQRQELRSGVPDPPRRRGLPLAPGAGTAGAQHRRRHRALGRHQHRHRGPARRPRQAACDQRHAGAPRGRAHARTRAHVDQLARPDGHDRRAR